MSEVCKLILGNRGSGKSVGNEIDLLTLAKDGEYAVVHFDRPGTAARRQVAHNSRHGIQDRTYLEIASATDRVMSWPFSPPSTATDPLRRKNDDDLAVEEMAQAFYARRNEKGGEAKPYTDRYLKAAIAVWRSQPIQRPLPWILKVFQPGSPEHEILMREAQDRESVAIFAKIEEIGVRNPTQYAIETGAAERILQPAGSPVVWLRNGNSVDWTELLLAKAQVYFDLSGITADAARTLAILAYTAIINACRRYHDTYRKPLKVVIVLEEAGALSLVTPLIITAMQELRKAGVMVWVISQTIQDFSDPLQFEQLMSLTDTHVYYRMNAGLDRAAADIATPIFDSKEVHYERERLINDGVEPIKTLSIGKSVGPGGGERTDEREGVAFIAKYRPVIDQYFKPYNLKESEVRQQLATQKVGQRTIRDLLGVRQETVIPLPEPWALGLTESRTEDAINSIRSRPCYQPPQIIEPSAPQKPKGKKGVR